MKSFTIAAVLFLVSYGSYEAVYANVVEDEHYVMSMEDIALLDRLEPPQPGYEYARCRKGDCYIVTTGERIGEGPDGIYMVWSTSEEK